MFKRIASSAAAWSFLVTALRTGGAVFMLPVILRKLPSEQLAMWYVFNSLGSFGALLDVGIAPMTIRVAGYFAAGTRELLAFGIHTGEESKADGRPNYPGLRDLAATLRRYYKFLGTICFLVMIVGGGSWIWFKTNGLATQNAIRLAYFIWCLGALLNFTGDLWPNLLTGLGEIRKAQQISLVALLTYYVIAAGGLLWGVGLGALVVGNLIMGLIQRQTGRWIVTKRLAGDGVRSPGTFRFELLKTMWPNAWRIAMVSTGAFLILQSSTLICSGFLDLKTTASYGLTMQVVTMVYSLSTIWVVVKFPLINQWRAQHRSQEISALFISRLRLSLITYLLGALGIFFVVPRLLAILHSKTQLIPAGPLMLLLTSQLLDFHHNLYGGLIYTENRNPLVRPVLISGIVIAGLSCILTPRLGLYGIVLSIMLVQASFNNWWVVLRGIAGLQIEPRLYWKQFFGLKPL